MENFQIQNIDSEQYLNQNYEQKDIILLNPIEINKEFGKDNDIIEFHIISPNNTILESNYNYTNYNNRNNIDNSNLFDTIEINPENDLLSYGYNKGQFDVLYNFNRLLFNSSNISKFYVKEISRDRTEIKISSNNISYLDLQSKYIEYITNRNERNFDPAFMAGSFRLKDGQISAPIKSKFGYHLIQLISRSGDDAVVKHILRIPPITNDEINETKHLLDSIKKEVLAGRLIFGEAVNKYSDDEGSKFSGGSITGNDGSAYVNLDQLDKDMIMVVKNMKPGEISEPQVYVDERGRKTVRLIYFKERSAPHKENLKEDYNKVSVRALEEKKAKAMEAWFKEHINNYYIYLDPEYNVCKELVDWNKVANNIIKVN